MKSPGIAPLLTPQGWALLESLPPYDAQHVNSLRDSLLAQDNSPDLVAAAVEQSKLRWQARGKFGPFAAGMLFTADGLAGATSLQIAARHAQRYVSAGTDRVADLGCGIGADSMALATLEREVVAVEWDEATAAAATVNLRHWGNATVRHEDAIETDLRDVTAVFLDPTRKAASRRGAVSGKQLLDGTSGSPPMSFAFDLATKLPAVGIKIGADLPHHLAPQGAQTQWISVGGCAQEACVWFGLLRHEGVKRSALVLPADPDSDVLPVEVTDVGLPQPGSGDVCGVIYEPDEAIVRAGLVGHVAAETNAHLVNPTSPLLTAESHTATPLARAYRVLDHFPYQVKTLQTWLRENEVGQVKLKRYSTSIDTHHIRRQLHLSGEATATILFTRIAARPHAIITQPM